MSRVRRVETREWKGPCKAGGDSRLESPALGGWRVRRVREPAVRNQNALPVGRAVLSRTRGRNVLSGAGLVEVLGAGIPCMGWSTVRRAVISVEPPLLGETSMLTRRPDRLGHLGRGNFPPPDGACPGASGTGRRRQHGFV